MRFKALLAQWQGVILLLVGCVSSIWLAATKQLNLYIHPRYITFTATMAVIGLGLSYLSFRRSIATKDMSPEPTTVPRFRTAKSVLVTAICLSTALSLLIVKPATLTTATAQQRGINSSTSTTVTATNVVPLFGNSDYTSLSVKDWAALLSQTSDPSFFTGKTANITGFINPDTDDPQNVFYVSRFVITCCAIDARPIGVPVYAPHWQATYVADQWVQVAGAFVSNPSSRSQQHIVIMPTKLMSVKQPEEPYVY